MISVCRSVVLVAIVPVRGCGNAICSVAACNATCCGYTWHDTATTCAAVLRGRWEVLDMMLMLVMIMVMAQVLVMILQLIIMAIVVAVAALRLI